MKLIFKTYQFCGSAALFFLLISAYGCNPTKYVKDGERLLTRNSIQIKSDQTLTRKGELSDQINSIVIQKPNTKLAGVIIPYKLLIYNMRYNKIQRDSTILESRSLERPVIYDSTLAEKSTANIKAFLFNKGYFYADVQDTVDLVGDKKIKAIYKINTGNNFIIRKVELDVDDSSILDIVKSSMSETLLKPGEEFSAGLAEEERARLTALIRNEGYYKFTQENIVTVQIDTTDKLYVNEKGNLVENTINFLTLQGKNIKPTLNLKIVIRDNRQPETYEKYKISSVMVMPDFVERSDFEDADMYTSTVQDVQFRYHKKYVHEAVLLRNIFLNSGDYFSQKNYDLTISKLNELGIFNYVRVFLSEDTAHREDRRLRAFILLDPNKRYDIATNFDISTSSVYRFGNSIGLSIIDKNFLKGAINFSTTVSAGIELSFNGERSNNFLRNFYLFSRNAGITTSFTIPRFLIPFKINSFKKENLPRTNISIGASILDRVQFFTLANINASFTYQWRQNQSNFWEFSPAFISLFNPLRISQEFQNRLDNDEFLRKSYEEVFLEGESVSYLFSNQEVRNNKNYTYFKAGVEEVGGLLSGIYSVLDQLGTQGTLNYAQYLKFDGDFRRYLTRKHSMLVLRGSVGIGVPYGRSSTLPYTKQYFVGGPYSLRGWSARQLGPGGYLDTSSGNSKLFIDRTGDIRLEANAEYRFDMIQLFSGAVKLNGALFVDAGNIWLAQPSAEYPNGTLSWNRLGHDIAVNVGTGARLDFGGFLVLRLDLGMPIKKPYIETNNGWVLKDINFNNSSWRRDNLNFNIAIGYPF